MAIMCTNEGMDVHRRSCPLQNILEQGLKVTLTTKGRCLGEGLLGGWAGRGGRNRSPKRIPARGTAGIHSGWLVAVPFQAPSTVPPRAATQNPVSGKAANSRGKQKGESNSPPPP